VVCVTGSRRCRCKHGGWRCCGDCTTEARYSCANEEDGCRGGAAMVREGCGNGGYGRRGAVVAGEMKRCGGGCHGDGRRGEN